MEDKSKKKSRDSHSNFRKGLTDYHDGENVTDYLANEHWDGASLPDPYEKENARLDGKVAEGNDFLEEDEDTSHQDVSKNSDQTHT